MNETRKSSDLGKRSNGVSARSNHFSLVPLLVTGQTISPKACDALRENRIKEAALILMSDYGLTCVEAGDLLDVSACG